MNNIQKQEIADIIYEKRSGEVGNKIFIEFKSQRQKIDFTNMKMVSVSDPCFLGWNKKVDND